MKIRQLVSGRFDFKAVFSVVVFSFKSPIQAFLKLISFWLCWIFIAVRVLSSCSERGLVSRCGVWAYCGGFSCCRALALRHASFKLWHKGSVAEAARLKSTASVVVVHGFSCSSACGIFSDQGSNPCFQHWQENSSSLSYQGSPNFAYFLMFCNCNSCFLSGFF